MKKLLVAAMTGAVAIGAFAAPAFASTPGENRDVRAEVVDSALGSLTLDNGITIDSSWANFPIPSAQAGDTVVLKLDSSLQVRNVRVLN
ncbi:MAG: hypothetical protein AAGH60_03815 [Pseudomonadota bacterium]